MDDKLLTLKDLAEYLNVSRRTIYRLLNGEKLPAYRVGKHRRFKREDIDEWLKDQKIDETKKSEESSLE